MKNKLREPSYLAISVEIRRAVDQVLTEQKAGPDTITAVNEAVALTTKDANMPVKDFSLAVIKSVNEALQKTNAVGIIPFMDTGITKVAASQKIQPEPQQPEKIVNNHEQNKDGWGNQYSDYNNKKNIK